jgi:hypothetical protein
MHIAFPLFLFFSSSTLLNNGYVRGVDSTILKIKINDQMVGKRRGK